MADGGLSKDFTFHVEVPFATAADATVVMNTLRVDPELQPNKVSKELSVDGSILKIEFAATEVRLLRASVSANMDLLALATRAVEQFGSAPY
mmetsp:Transcript_70253/g.222797  ORF Transcript_70253/g.222797 Transcript_70253/m.222797 type:complete len:92 (+) Transcript_70253:374-649(+)